MSRTIKMKVRELQDANVSHISLVKRGANRLPFRVIKSEGENDMSLDLSNLFLRKQEVVPTVVGLALQKGEYGDDVLEKLKAVGLIGTIDNTQQTVTLVKSESFVDGQEVEGIELKNGAVLLVTDLKKALTPYLATTFGEAVSANSVYSGLDTATGTFRNMLWDILYADGVGKEETIAAATSLMDEYKTYMLGLLQIVPVSLFKMEGETFETAPEGVEVEIKAPVVEGEVAESETTEVTEETGGEAIEETIEETTEQAGDEVGTTSTETSEEEPKEPVAVAKSEDIAALTVILTTLTESLTTFQKSVDDRFETLGVKIEKAEEVSATAVQSAADAMKALNGKTKLTKEEDSLSSLVNGNKNKGELFASAFAFEGFEVH